MGWVNPRGPMQLVGADWQLGVELARSSFMILAVKPASHRGIRSERGGHYILIIQMHATRDDFSLRMGSLRLLRLIRVCDYSLFAFLG